LLIASAENAPWLQKFEFWRGFRRPGIGLVIGCNDPISTCSQEPAQRRDIESMVSRSEPGQVPLGEPEETNCRRQAPAMFRVKWVLKSLLKMDKSSSGLNQSLEIVCIRRFVPEPELLEDIVRLVVTFFIPAMEKRAIKWMFRDVFLLRIDIFDNQLGHEPRNPLAFVHEELNLAAAQTMSKPSRISFSEERYCPHPEADFFQLARLCRHKK